MFLNRRLIFLLLGLLRVVIITAIIIAVKTNNKYLSAASWVEHTHEVLFETERLSSVAKDVQINSWNYIIIIDKAFLVSDFETIKNN